MPEGGTDAARTHDAETPRDAADARSDSGAPSPTTFPAFLPDIGQIVDKGGPVLTAPVIVTITWSTDPVAPALQDFGDLIGASSYWSVVKEYGVGPASSGAANHVVVTTPPPSPWADTDIESWVVEQLESDAGGWPAPTAQTLYILYTPASVQVTSDGADACYGYYGYHDEIQVGQNQHVPFALAVGACNAGGSVQDNDTETGAHEIAEASTDPEDESNLAWTGFDVQHWSWELFQSLQDEIADACENYPDSYYTEGADLPYAVQRLWSNASAAAGHNPCVPLESGAYFNVTPLDQESIHVSLPIDPPEAATTKGFRIPVGTTRTFQVGLYSDAATTPWDVQGVEGDGMKPPANSVLVIALDQGNGNNADIINVTVQVVGTPPQSGVLMTMLSTRGPLVHSMPILIGAY
jgi:hypothetical protein